MLDFDRTARRVPDQGFAVLNFKIRPDPYVLSYCRPICEFRVRGGRNVGYNIASQ
jgi:hypothetical protein